MSEYCTEGKPAVYPLSLISTSVPKYIFLIFCSLLFPGKPGYNTCIDEAYSLLLGSAQRSVKSRYFLIAALTFSRSFMQNWIVDIDQEKGKIFVLGLPLLLRGYFDGKKH